MATSRCYATRTRSAPPPRCSRAYRRSASLYVFISSTTSTPGQGSVSWLRIDLLRLLHAQAFDFSALQPHGAHLDLANPFSRSIAADDLPQREAPTREAPPPERGLSAD